MKLGCLVRVREGCGHLSGGIYTYENRCLGGPDQDVKFLFGHGDVGILLEMAKTDKYEHIEPELSAKILTPMGVGWVPKKYIREVRRC